MEIDVLGKQILRTCVSALIAPLVKSRSRLRVLAGVYGVTSHVEESFQSLFLAMERFARKTARRIARKQVCIPGVGIRLCHAVQVYKDVSPDFYAGSRDCVVQALAH